MEVNKRDIYAPYTENFTFADMHYVTTKFQRENKQPLCNERSSIVSFLELNGLFMSRRRRNNMTSVFYKVTMGTLEP